VWVSRDEERIWVRGVGRERRGEGGCC